MCTCARARDRPSVCPLWVMKARQGETKLPKVNSRVATKTSVSSPLDQLIRKYMENLCGGLHLYI